MRTLAFVAPAALVTTPVVLATSMVLTAPVVVVPVLVTTPVVLVMARAPLVAAQHRERAATGVHTTTRLAVLITAALATVLTTPVVLTTP
ncbi:hypothetical protein ABT274_00250, partial [Streptomyces sp. NPDC001127]